LVTTEVTIQLARYTTELNSVRSFCIDTVFAFCSVSQRSLELCTFVLVQTAQTSIPLHGPYIQCVLVKIQSKYRAHILFKKKLKKWILFKYLNSDSNLGYHGFNDSDILNDNFTDFY